MRVVKRGVAWLLTAAMLGSFGMSVTAGRADAASKVKIKSVKVKNVSGKKLTLEKGDSFSLKVNVKAVPNKAKYKKVSFKSSSSKTVSVSAKGKLRAKNEGKAKITVTAKKNKKKKAVITVTVTDKNKKGTPTPVPSAGANPSPSAGGSATGTPAASSAALTTSSAAPTPTPIPTPTPEPDGTSTLSRKPYAVQAYVGSKLADVSIGGGSIVDSNGSEIKGSYSWADPDTALNAAGKKHYEVNFTPENDKFAQVKNISIQVLTAKNPVTLKLPKASSITTTQSLASSTLKNGTATDRAGNEVKGTFSWMDGSIVPKEAGSKKYGVIFTPEDSDKYRSEACYVKVDVTGATSGSQSGASTNVLDGSSLKGFLQDTFGKVGTAHGWWELGDNSMVEFSKSQFNGYTMGNEMKPELIFAVDNDKPVLSDSNPAGYVDTSKFRYKYMDSKYPVIKMDTIDSYIRQAYENGMKIRYHVFLWHTQTPRWLFKVGFGTSKKSAFVSPEVMNGRMEYMIRNVMTHIYNLKNEKGVYIGREVIDSWDVVNEYLHNYDKGIKSYWDEVYYPEYEFKKGKHSGILTPVYVKEAFSLAYSILEDFNLTDNVNLLSNDFNTYMQPEKIVKMLNYVNTKDEINPDGKTICSGVGMQMHLDTTYPTVESVQNTIEAFREAGFEIQITEFDMTEYSTTDPSFTNQINLWYNLSKMILIEKDRGAKITGVTWWGPSDNYSWRRDGVPLLFSVAWQAKEHYFKFLQAVSDYNEGETDYIG